MANFVQVPAEKIEGLLKRLGFVPNVTGREITYTKASQRNQNVYIKVYTSIKIGHQSVRDAGKDSIRVCVVFDNGRRSFGIGKFPPIMRVHSIESVLERLQERIIAAAERGTEWMDEQEARFAAKNPPETKVDFSRQPSYLHFLRMMGETVDEYVDDADEREREAG